MKIEDFKNKLELNGLGKYFAKLSPLLKNTIRLYPQAADENNIAIGQSKIGGRPDLPATISWVTEVNIVESAQNNIDISENKTQEIISKPLSFIAQINLAEIAAFDQENLFPKNGILYFFYSAEQEVWGYDPKDKNGFKVIYWHGDFSQLKRTDFPSELPEYSCYKPCLLDIKAEISIPPYEHDVYQDFSEEETDQFWDYVYDDVIFNKLLGYADNVQDSMELECELVTNGLYCGDSSGYQDPRAKVLEANAKNWRLLLQIDSNDENEMMWGDCGRIYFWIKEDDLLNKDFDQAWFCLQCG